MFCGPPVGSLQASWIATRRRKAYSACRCSAMTIVAARLYADGHRNAFVAIGRNDLRRTLGTRLREIGFTIVTTGSSERHDFAVGDHRRRERDHATCDHQCRRQDRRFRDHQHRSDRRARLHHWGGGACRAALCHWRGSDDRGRGLIRDWSSRTAAQRHRRRFDGRSGRGGGRQCSTVADRGRHTGAAVAKHVRKPIESGSLS